MKSNIFKGLNRKRFIYNEKLMMNVFKKGLVVAFLFVVFISVIIPIKKEEKEDTVSAQSMPSVSFFATKEQLMNDFTLANGDENDTVGYVNFGKDENGDVMQWYIVGKDDGIIGDNMILFANDVMAISSYNDSSKSNIYDDAWNCEYSVDMTGKTVWSNHYGISKVRDIINNDFNNNTEKHFSKSQKSIINRTAVSSIDAVNKNDNDINLEYITKDWVYVGCVKYIDNNAIGVSLGSLDNIVVKNDYLMNEETFTRNCSTTKGSLIVTKVKNGTITQYASYEKSIVPATNIDLSSVLFTSAVTVATNIDKKVGGIITPNTAMDIRLDGKDILRKSSVKYDKHKVQYTATNRQSVVVQGNDSNGEWYYSEYIDDNVDGEILATDIQTKLGLSYTPDLTLCKVWVEETGVDGMKYAVMGKQIYEEISVTAFASKEQLMSKFSMDVASSTMGYINFGTNDLDGDGIKEEMIWNIVGKDNGIDKDNIVLFSTKSLCEGQVFNTNNNPTYTYEPNTGYGATSGTVAVTTSHYGMSNIRSLLKNMTNESSEYFSTKEIELMNETIITTEDYKNQDAEGNNIRYVLKDKLYLGTGYEHGDGYFYLGSNDDMKVIKATWGREGIFWLRSTYYNATGTACAVSSSLYVTYYGPGMQHLVRPAFNLDLSNVLFSSASVAATSSTTVTSGNISADTAMDLRLDGEGKSSFKYTEVYFEQDKIEYNIQAGQSIVVQGNDGTNDWYYSKYATDNKTYATLTAQEIADALGHVNAPDFNKCKIWIEQMLDDGMRYAVMGEDKEINIITTEKTPKYAIKDEMMSLFTLANEDTSKNTLGYLNFGRDENGDIMKWHIIGKDNGNVVDENNDIVAENLTLFAAKPYLYWKSFKGTNSLIYDSSWGCIYPEGYTIESVKGTHYGASGLRLDYFKTMEKDENYFIKKEQSMMNLSTITSYDQAYNVNYSVQDKLYVVDGKGGRQPILCGSNSDIAVNMRYWGNDYFVTRGINTSTDYILYTAYPYSGMWNGSSGDNYNIYPALNIDLTSVLFACAADNAPLYEYGRTIDKDEAMSLRLDGTDKLDDTYVKYNTDKVVYTGVKGQYVVVQGKDGENDWYYRKYIDADSTHYSISAETITNVVGLSELIDVSECKVWIEQEIDGMLYAIMGEEINTEIDASVYSSKRQLMRDFSLASGDDTDKVGYIKFGKDEDGNVMKWYVTKKDEGVKGDNITLYAATKYDKAVAFEATTGTKIYSSQWNSIYETEPSSVYINNYGASDVRLEVLKKYESSTDKFTNVEQQLMNSVKLKTKDTLNNTEYVVEDKLYLGSGEMGKNYITFGVNDDIKVNNNYWESSNMWLRSPNPDFQQMTTVGKKGSTVQSLNVTYLIYIRPAVNINLSSVLFASAVTAATSNNTLTNGTVTTDTGMVLRHNGSERLANVSLTYDISNIKYTARAGQSIVLQGNDGINNWYYSKYITSNTTATLTASSIGSAVGLAEMPDLTKCKVWIEETDENGTVYAVMGDEILHTSDISMFATKDNLMNDFTLVNSDMTLNKVGYINFGKADADEDGVYNTMRWYILGKDSGVNGDNVVLWSSRPFVNKLLYARSDLSNWNYDVSYGTYETVPTTISGNHYGASNIRKYLKEMVNEDNETYFSINEKTLMNTTTFYTDDLRNSSKYSLSEILYPPYAVNNANWIYFGSDDKLGVYWPYWYHKSVGYYMWVRTPGDSGNLTLATNSSYVGMWGTNNDHSLGAAFDLNLSNIAFSSAVPITISTSTSTIESDAAMNLRLDGRSSMSSVSAEYNASRIIYSSTANKVLVVQGNDGTNEWYYTMKIEEDVTDGVLKAATIRNKVGLSDTPNLKGCNVWIEETTDTGTYAVLATQKIDHIDIGDINEPIANVDLDTTASCNTLGIDTENPIVRWTLSGEDVTKAGYNKIYTASVTLKMNLKYRLSEDVTAYINGRAATVIDNNDGTVTLKYTFDRTDKGIMEIPTISIDYINEKLTGFESGQNYIINGVEYANITATLNIASSVFGTTVSIVRKSNNIDYVDSMPQYVEVPKRPDAPTGLYTTQESYKGFNDGQIRNTNNSMEYKLTTDSVWNTCGNISSTHKKPGTYEVRYKATSTSFVGEIATVTIQASDKAYYNVDISWGNLEYKYEGQWDTNTLRYEPEEGTTGWSLVTPGLGSDEITIMNNSNVEVEGKIEALLNDNYAQNYPSNNNLNFILKNSLNQEDNRFILDDSFGDTTGKKLIEKYRLEIEGSPRVLPQEKVAIANITITLGE